MDFMFDPSLVLYLPLHKLDGASIMSKDAYGHLCAVTGALWRPDGRSFDGSDDLVNIDSAVTPLSSTTAGTFEAWVYSLEPNNTSTALVCFGDTDANTFLYYGIVNGKEWGAAYIAGTQQWELYTDVLLNDYQNWLHLVLVQDGVAPVFYVNGVSVPITFQASTDKTAWFSGLSGIDNGRIALRDKNNGTTYPFEGRIGEVRIYSRALSPVEIQRNYLATKWRYQ